MGILRYEKFLPAALCTKIDRGMGVGSSVHPGKYLILQNWHKNIYVVESGFVGKCIFRGNGTYNCQRPYLYKC